MDTSEKTIYILFLIAAAILGLILVYFFITVIRQQRKTAILHLEKVQAEIRTLERERQRIASDLHDDLGPILSAIKFKINAVELASEEDIRLIEMASRHIDDGLARIREISFDLMPNSLLRKGLIATIEEIILKTEKQTPLTIQFIHKGNDDLSDEICVNLYRIIMEIMQNSIKHSGGSELILQLTIERKKIIFHSQDDGIGFDADVVNNSSDGLGLKNLKSRTEIMGGELMLDTAAGKGVHCYFEIPL